jgi:hypothetical protein
MASSIDLVIILPDLLITYGSEQMHPPHRRKISYPEKSYYVRFYQR